MKLIRENKHNLCLIKVKFQIIINTIIIIIITVVIIIISSAKRPKASLDLPQNYLPILHFFFDFSYVVSSNSSLYLR